MKKGGTEIMGSGKPPGLALAGRLLAVAIVILTAGIGFSYGMEPETGTIRDVRIPAPEDVGPPVYLTDPGVPLTPPPDPEVGDSWVWWLWVHDPMPPHFEQHVCTVRGKSDRGYVVVRDLEWNVSIDQADVDSILDYWENRSIGPYPDQGIYDVCSFAFGDPPDELDDDPRIYLLWFDFKISADGFFFYFDQYPEGTFPGYQSNECEVLYLNTMSQGGPSGAYMLAVVAHEFEHMIHWKYDEDEVSWVDEGLAELAMWFFGNPDNISGFNSNPDNDLTDWGGTWADYIQTYLWSLYFFERYGGHPAIFAVVHEPANSIAGYNEVLAEFGYSEDFADVFAEWAVANFLDDTTLEDGRYGYTGDDLPPFSVSGSYSGYPVTDVYKTVNYWAADYYRFTGFEGETLSLSFDGSDDNTFAVWALAILTDSPTEVHRMTLDESSQSGSITVSGLADPYDQVILVVAATSGSGGKGYFFSAWESQGIEEDSFATGSLSLSAEPNPFSSEVNLILHWSGYPGEGYPTVEIFDISGRMITRIETGLFRNGEALAVWDGTVSQGGPAPPGIYFARVRNGTQSVTQSLLLLR